MTHRKTALARRTFLLGGAALGAGATLVGPAAATPAPAAHPVISVAKRVGRLEVVAVLDASGAFPLGRQDAFPTATLSDWDAARGIDPGAFGPGETWRLNFHCFAIRRPAGRITLVDTGIGPVGGPASGWAPVPGRLPSALPEAGIDAGDVDVVVLTHLHEDHFGWSVSPEGVAMFPNARYVVQRDEVAALAPDDVAHNYVVNPLRRTGQLHEIDGRTQLPNGDRACRELITAVPTPGHTPGHQSVLVEGAGRQVVITGDVLVHAVQLADPGVGYVFESDQDTAAHTRRVLLAYARHRRSLLATAHLTRPFVDVPGTA